MKKTAVINVVGLTKSLLGTHTPFLSEWIAKQQLSFIDPVLPAVTCSAQATYLTGKWPNEHGIVANGWYFRDECEVKLWRQSNKLVEAPKLWELAREKDASFTCANMFWWYNMYSSADYSATPRPQYLADGRKLPDCYSYPADLRDRLQEELGTFPLFHFWGPKTSVKSSEWIAKASQRVYDWHHPTLTLVYLPHLDYNLQKLGPKHPKTAQDLQEIDAVCADLIRFFEERQVQVILLSEYGITPVSKPIHINRILREKGWINVRTERGLELLDAGASAAFAMADHQIAHIYVNDQEQIAAVKKVLEQTAGIEEVLDEEGKKKYHLDHSRSGELIAVADKDSWFTYYYWLDDRKAPDFARTVDIHRKPGYDPVELFLDPEKKLIIPRIALKLLKKKLGFRTLLDVIPLDANLVKGAHGRTRVADEDKPVFISNSKQATSLQANDVCDAILNNIF